MLLLQSTTQSHKYNRKGGHNIGSALIVQLTNRHGSPPGVSVNKQISYFTMGSIGGELDPQDWRKPEFSAGSDAIHMGSLCRSRPALQHPSSTVWFMINP